ncbi:MAG TPA: PKD domain-containing protein, partial [Gaiellales bacterium]
TPYDGTRHPVRLSYYDARPPVLTAPTLTGGPYAGIPVTLATTASDAWSVVGAPVWTFGDGGTAAGLSVAHTYAAGTYTAHVGVTDALGNTSGTDVAVVVQAAAVTIGDARFSAKWKHSRVGGTLTVAGTAPVSGSYVLDVSRGRTRRIHVTLKLAPGAYSRAIRLPATLLPGGYHLTLTPSTTGVAGAAFDVLLAPPSEGVVDVVALSSARGGKALHSAHGPRSLWARFHFAAVPKATVKLKITWYRTYRGKRTTLAKVLKTPTTTVTSSVALHGRKGTISAVLTRGGKIVVQSSARVT